MKDLAVIRKKIKNLPEDRQAVAGNLLAKVVFMSDQLDSLQETIKQNGWSEKYQNGRNQYGMKRTAEGDVYLSLVKNYTVALKTLNDMLPEDLGEPDELDEFLKQGA